MQPDVPRLWYTPRNLKRPPGVQVTGPQASVVRFGSFELDSRIGELRRNGSKVKLREQSFQLLKVLVEKRGEPVTREELRQVLWPQGIHVDFERSLNQAVARLRETLEDSPESPRFIETLPRHGYRFVAPLEWVGGDSIPDEPAVAALSGPGKRWRWFLGSVVAGLLGGAVVVAMLLGPNLFSWRQWLLKQSSTPPPIRSLAVLPLVNLSGDPNEEYFADGMTEALITELGKLGSLRVISRTTAMRYKRSDKSLAAIAKELSVDGVVEGSVARSEHQIRVTVQLVRAATDRQLWAATYERNVGDILVLEGEVAHSIAREIGLKLAPREEALLAARSVNPSAYEAYLKGRYYWNKRSAEGLKKGIEYFQQAIDRDPAYAPAYAGLADCFSLEPWLSELSREETLSRARAAASRALAIDDKLPEAHASLGIVEAWNLNWQDAEREYRRAIELNPSYATAHHWYGLYLAWTGHQQEGVAELRQAVLLDPLSPIISTDLGWVFYSAHQPDSAIAELRKALDLAPNFPWAHRCLALAYEQKGDFPKALAEMQEALELSGGNVEIKARLGHIYATSGNKREARKVLNDLAKAPKNVWASALQAVVYVGLGEKSKALVALEKAYEERSAEMWALKADPTYDELRSDPRFQDLERRVGLAP